FWTGLLLVAIQRAQSKRWLRWPVYLTALALPVLVFPAHYKEAAYWRTTRWNAESAAATLVNGVRDEQIIRVLDLGGIGPELINRTFYLGKLPAKITANWFVGYIRDYDPQLDYAVRSADNGALSEEKIPVKLPVTKPAKP